MGRDPTGPACDHRLQELHAIACPSRALTSAFATGDERSRLALRRREGSPAVEPLRRRRRLALSRSASCPRA